jgi:hypothetical protein
LLPNINLPSRLYMSLPVQPDLEPVTSGAIGPLARRRFS